MDLQHKPIQERRLFARLGHLISVALGLSAVSGLRKPDTVDPVIGGESQRYSGFFMISGTMKSVALALRELVTRGVGVVGSSGTDREFP